MPTRSLNLDEGVKKARIIMAMLDYDYAFEEGMSRDEREALDVERQLFALRMGWPSMSIAELEDQCLELLGHLHY